MRRLWRVAMVTTLALALATLMPLATNVASAHPLRVCYGSFCIYEPHAISGCCDRGTQTEIDVVQNATLYHTDEVIAGSVWLYQDSNTAIETGIAYGDTIGCGWYLHWHPYGTLNNGANEQDDCGYWLSPGSSWWIVSFVNTSDNDHGFSSFEDTNYNVKWSHDWGTYNIQATNLDQTEVHGDGDYPYYGSPMDFTNEQYWSGSRWYSWGSQTVSGDSPYDASKVSNTYWYSWDSQ